jgi:hypothetical protein
MIWSLPAESLPPCWIESDPLTLFGLPPRDPNDDDDDEDEEDDEDEDQQPPVVREPDDEDYRRRAECGLRSMGRDRQRDRVEDADYAPLLDCHPSPRPSGARTHLLSGRHGFGMKSTSSVLFFLDLEGSPELQLISKFDYFQGEAPRDVVS